MIWGMGNGEWGMGEWGIGNKTITHYLLPITYYLLPIN